MRTYISVPQTDALSMTPGLNADVTVAEYPNRTFAGHVVRTSRRHWMRASRTLLTEVDIVNPGGVALGDVRAGASASHDAAPSLILPSTALVVRSSGTQVVIVEPSQPGQVATIRFVPVTIGRDFGGTIEVQSGVQDG